MKCTDFLLIANVTKKQLTPDENLKLFRDYQSRHQRAETAYLYLLFDYEMIDKAGGVSTMSMTLTTLSVFGHCMTLNHASEV